MFGWMTLSLMWWPMPLPLRPTARPEKFRKRPSTWILRTDYFATTRWTLVLTAARRDAPEAGAALEELCRTYWYPLYAYVRRQGQAREDAEDLTQSFFVRLLERNYLDG